MTKILGSFFFSTLSSQEIIPPLEGPSKKEEEEGSLFLSRSLFFPFIFFLFLRKWVISLVGPRSLHPPLALWSEHIKEGWGGEGGKEIVIHSARCSYGTPGRVWPNKKGRGLSAADQKNRLGPWGRKVWCCRPRRFLFFASRHTCHVCTEYGVRSVHCSRYKKMKWKNVTLVLGYAHNSNLLFLPPEFADRQLFT